MQLPHYENKWDLKNVSILLIATMSRNSTNPCECCTVLTFMQIWLMIFSEIHHFWSSKQDIKPSVIQSFFSWCLWRCRHTWHESVTFTKNTAKDCEAQFFNVLHESRVQCVPNHDGTQRSHFTTPKHTKRADETQNDRTVLIKIFFYN